MSNLNSAPYHPPQNLRYHSLIPRADIVNPNYQAGYFHQTIPSLVFNHDPHSAPGQNNPGFPLLAPEPQIKQEPLNSIPLVLNPLGQQRPFSLPNTFGMHPAPISNASGMYFMPLAPVYPPHRAIGDDRFMGARPMFGERFPAHLAKFPGDSVPVLMYQSNFIPVQHPEAVYSAPNPGMYESGESVASYGNRPGSVENDTKNYKPTHTKKNSRPKINKIVNVPKKHTRKRRYEIGEHSNDELFAKFLEVLGIKSERTDLRKSYRLIIEDPLEQKLFDLFVNQLSVFIDVFLAEKHFQKIIPELALLDETRLILDSIFCFSSLIFQRMSPSDIDPLCPLKYYQKVVNSIRYHLSLPEADIPETGILARCLISTNILCIYELFFIAIDSTYVKGAGSILLSILSKWNKSESLLKDSPFYNTCFWAMFVCDLILSLKLEARTTYSLEKTWRALEPEFFESFETYPEENTEPVEGGVTQLLQSSYLVSRKATTYWLHKIMMLFCDITEYLNACEVTTKEDFEANTKFEKWKSLELKLNDFEMNMPIYLKPLITKPSSPDRLFPLIYFRDEQTAIVALNFKLAKLSLHVALCRNTVVKDTNLVKKAKDGYPEDFREKLCKDLVGIMCTYDSNQKIWPVNIHALRQVSKYLKKDSVEYAELKKLVMRIAKFMHAGANVISIVQTKQPTPVEQ